MHSITYKNFLAFGITGLITNRFLIRFLLFILISLWCMGFISAVIFPGSVYVLIASPFLKKIYSTVCHQHIEKTIAYNGHFFLVCARCTGIYLGALFISFISIFTLRRLPQKLTLLYIASIPMIIDVALTTTGLYGYSKITAFITGIFFGSAVFTYILAAIDNNFVDKSF